MRESQDIRHIDTIYSGVKKKYPRHRMSIVIFWFQASGKSEIEVFVEELSASSAGSITYRPWDRFLLQKRCIMKTGCYWQAFGIRVRVEGENGPRGSYFPTRCSCLSFSLQTYSRSSSSGANFNSRRSFQGRS